MQRFENILVVVDGNSETQLVLERAIEVASHHQARLKLVDVVREFNWLQRIAVAKHQELQEQVAADKSRILDSLAETARQQHVNASTAVLRGPASTEIIREAIRGRHDLVMKQAKGESWFKGFFGQTGMQLLRKCPCPVWLVKPGPHPQYERVMAAVDASCVDEAHDRLNRKILDLALLLCRREGSSLDVVQAWSVFGEDILSHHTPRHEYEQLIERSRKEAEQCFDALLRAYDMTKESDNAHLLHGDPSLVLPQYAEQQQIDLIVLGTVGRTGVAGVMGNTAETLLGKVKCSVLAVKPDDFVSPISG